MLRCGRRHTRVLLAGFIWLAFLGAAGTASASDNIDNVTYQGGPVAHSMTGVIVDWGTVNSIYTNETTGDPGLIKYLASESGSTGDIGGVLAQYMDSSGENAANDVSYGQQYTISPSDSSTTIDDSQIQTELADEIDAGTLPAPAGNGLSTIYLVLFPSTDVECYDPTECSANYPDQSDAVFCSYHSSFLLSGTTNVLYAVLPDDTGGPQSYECGPNSNVFDNQTSYLSHEWSEAITDPLGDAWWVDNPNSPDYENEIADNCNQLETSEGGWTVQELWSNIDGNCTGSEPAYSAPTASFLAPDVAAPGAPVSFDASSSTDPSGNDTAISGTGYAISSGIASYEWNWGDGSSTTTSTPTASHTYASLGNYQVSLTVVDDLGFTSTVTQPISITSNGTPTPALTTGGTTGVSASGATLEGEVNSENQSTEYQFVYGTSPSAMTSSTPDTAGPIGQTNTEVSATLSGLQGSTTYYYELELSANGQTYHGSVQSFTTDQAPPPPQTPVAGTGSAASISTSSAVVSGTVNPAGPDPVTYRFSYGTSPTSLGSSTGPSGDLTGTTSVPVSSILTGLAPHTTYYFRVDIAFGGQTFSGAVESFTTRASAPGVSTGGASAITSSGATVTGSVSPSGVPTNYLVEFGKTEAYGHSTPAVSAGAGTGTVPVTATLSGLEPLTIYHYRLVAISAGGTAIGADRTFMTAAAPAPAPRFSFTAIGGRNLRVRFHCSKACSARFTVTVPSAHLARLTPVTVALARASKSIHARGWGTLTIRFTPSIRRRLRHGRLRLIVIGYAVSRGSARSAPLARPVTLRR